MPFAFLLVLGLWLLACTPESNLPPGAVVLYKVDFGSPANTVGAPPKVADAGAEPTVPSSIPTSIFIGEPKVVAKVCGLEKQPVKLSLESGALLQAGLEFVLDPRFGSYHVELDLCVDGLGPPSIATNEPQLAVYLDILEAHALGFFSGGRLVAIDPARGVDAITDPKVIGSYEIGKPMHLALDFDVTKQSWSIAVDGKRLFEANTSVTMPRAVRFVIRGNEINAAGIDDVLIWAQNDLGGEREDPLAAPDEGAKQ